jgi:hypothetical protein
MNDALYADARLKCGFSARGQRYEWAIKSCLRDQRLKAYVVQEMAFGPDQHCTPMIDIGVRNYHRWIAPSTKMLQKAFKLDGDLAVVDAREPLAAFDMTELLVYGQRLAPSGVACAITHNESNKRDTLVLACDCRKYLLTKLFDVGGAANRVQLPFNRYEEVVDKVRRLSQASSSRFRPTIRNFFKKTSPWSRQKVYC